MRLSKPLIVLACLALAVGWWQQHRAATPSSALAPTPVAQDGSLDAGSTQPDLPPEAVAMLGRIARGGPFEHSQDGVVFGNYEGLLPQRPRGYYHEYTVPTPGARSRGARRLVVGGSPAAVWYYTDDHYRSFRRVEAGP